MLPDESSPTAHDDGFSDAVREAITEIKNGGRPRPLVLTTLSEQRIRWFGWDWFGKEAPVLLSSDTLGTESHSKRFLEFSDANWRVIARAVTEGTERYSGRRGTKTLLWFDGELHWAVSVKQAQGGGREVFLKTVYNANPRSVRKLRTKIEAEGERLGGR